MRNTINQLFKAAEKQGINFKIYSMEEEGFVTSVKMVIKSGCLHYTGMIQTKA